MGTPMFTMDMRDVPSPNSNVRTLRRALETMGDSLHCDLDLHPA